MNRIMLVVMIVAAVWLHFSYCEWEACKHEAIVSESRADRVLYYHYDRAGHDYFLLSKSAASRADATLYGIWVPLLVLGACVAVIRLEFGSTGS